MTRKSEEFTPSVVDEMPLAHGGIVYGVMLVQLQTCGHCNRPCLRTHGGNRGGVFPDWFAIDRGAQLRKADWGMLSSTCNAKGARLCDECAKEHGAFRCVLCKQERLGKPQESVGDPSEYLCTPCFETVPAKTWTDELARLEEAHRWDYS